MDYLNNFINIIFIFINYALGLHLSIFLIDNEYKIYFFNNI